LLFASFAYNQNRPRGQQPHPAGKIGYVLVDSAPIGNDHLCYVKDSSGWKIGGDTQ
jgi:hypothetical protein